MKITKNNIISFKKIEKEKHLYKESEINSP